MTCYSRIAKGPDMTRTMTLIALAGAVALAGCNSEEHNLVAGEIDDPMANSLANAAPVELPPAIQASKQYRCKDNSVVSVDWLSDNKTANFRAAPNEHAVQLKAPEPGQPLVAEGGYSLTGSASAASVTLARPGKGSQSCKA